MNDFDRRFLLARYRSGGVVVDLESGNYLRLNASAALVCDSLRIGGDAEGRIADELGVSATEAARMVADVTAGLTGPQVRGVPQGSYHFSPVGRGYVLRHGEKTVLEVDADLGIRLPSGLDAPGEAQLELYVRALAPKLLFQRGVTVLHASACLIAGRLVAFAGVSGAGKTTIAHAFADAGARLISEDLVVLPPEKGRPQVSLGAEALILSWAREATSRLGRSSEAVSSSELLGAIAGPTEALETILLLDRSRRAGNQLTTRPLDAPDALVALMMHDFLGAEEPDTWRRFFRSAAEIVDATKTVEVSTPDGVEYLPAAVSDYMAKYAS